MADDNRYKYVFSEPVSYANIGITEYTLTQLDFTRLNVPWVVSRGSSLATAPDEVSINTISGYTNDHNNGDLVGSAEQSFIELMNADILVPGNKYFSTTPCFRNEVEEDEFHLPYFMKTELFAFFETSVEAHACLKDFIEVADGIMKGLIPSFTGVDENLKPSIVPIHKSEYHHGITIQVDIHINHIEVGSYGVRKIGEDCYVVFGTGIAEPRFSQAVKVNIP